MEEATLDSHIDLNAYAFSVLVYIFCIENIITARTVHHKVAMATLDRNLVRPLATPGIYTFLRHFFLAQNFISLEAELFSAAARCMGGI